VITLLTSITFGWVVVPLALLRLSGRPAGGTERVAREGEAPNGPALYRRNCASCHGERGDGAGATAPYVSPRPRDFGEGLFRLKTTAAGMPTDDDLDRVVRAGIPGSAMPAFPDLTDAERRAVLAHVRELTRSGLHTRLRQKADQDGSIELSEVPDAVDKLTQVGPAIAIPDGFPPATPDSVANGKRLYQATCASCHGPEGRGDGPQVKELKNADGSPTRPRDLTIGNFKGGGEHRQLYARILIGMPGTPMPASVQLKPEEVGDIINYVRSLSRPATTAGATAAATPAVGPEGGAR
jgi:mono/diheme cytochrome c family protein